MINKIFQLQPIYRNLTKFRMSVKANILEITTKLWHHHKIFTAGVKLKLVCAATLTNCY